MYLFITIKHTFNIENEILFLFVAELMNAESAKTTKFVPNHYAMECFRATSFNVSR
jgi:hypothetical protein